MQPLRVQALDELLPGCFALFVFGSTFSIALAQIALGLSLIVFLVLIAAKRLNPFPAQLQYFYLAVGLYVGWMLVASLAGATPLRSVLITKEEWLFAAVPIGVYLMRRGSSRRLLVTAFAAGVAVFALYGVIQALTGMHWFKRVPPIEAPLFGYVVKGMFPSPMTFGNYYSTAAAFLIGLTVFEWRQFSPRLRLLFLGAGLLACSATILSYSRGGMLGMLAAALMLAVVLNRRWLYIGIAAVVVAGALAVTVSPETRERVRHNFAKEIDPTYEGGRLFIWTNTLDIVGQHPVTGVGQGNFEPEYRARLRADIPDHRKHVHAHNDLINLAAIAGIPGMVLFAAVWISLFWYIGRQWRASKAGDTIRPWLAAALLGSICFLTTSLTEATFADEEVRQMLMFVWAAGLWPAVYGIDQKERQPIRL